MKEEEIMKIKVEEKELKQQWRQFDIVVDESDHHYAKSNRSGKKKDGFDYYGSSTVRKKIMHEWKILENNLPDSIFVRAYEGRIDLLRAVIIGAEGTPYHDGLFFFDFHFPSDYPARPPDVHYRSYGLRINPNLYANGQVCLSLLNTWTGKKSEKWISSESTVLQVLISLQALVLNEKPYFNEPGYGVLPGLNWDKKSLAYNMDIFVLSCKTMMYVQQKPPKHFEDFVAAHFHDRAQAILIACKAYMDGLAQVGASLVQTGSASSSSSTAITAQSNKFKLSMSQIYPELVKAFIKTGASVGHFVEQEKPVEEESNKRLQLKPNRKDGFVKETFKKLKKILGLSTVAASSTSGKNNRRIS